MYVFPALNFFSEEEIKNVTYQKLEILKKKGVRTLHIDFSDGKFTEAKTLWGPNDFYNNFGKDFNFAVHLMVKNLKENIKNWIIYPNIQKIIFHLQEEFDFDFLFYLMESKKIDLELALSTKDNLNDFLDMILFLKLKSVEVLTVKPGFSGQKMQIEMLDKIKILKSQFKNLKFFVDGGVNKETIFKVKEVGADGVIVSSFLWKSEDILESYEFLEKI